MCNWWNVSQVNSRVNFIETRDVKFVFSKFEFQPLKFGLNSNFVYIFEEKLKQFAFDVCTVESFASMCHRLQQCELFQEWS